MPVAGMPAVQRYDKKDSEVNFVSGRENTGVRKM